MLSINNSHGIKTFNISNKQNKHQQKKHNIKKDKFLLGK